MLCNVSPFTISLDLAKDRMGRGDPDKGLGFGVRGAHELIDSGHEFLDTLEGPASDRPRGNAMESDFHLVQPGVISGGEVNMKAWSHRQPAFHPWVLVRRVVVDDDVNLQLLGNVLLDLAQKTQVLLVPMAAFRAANSVIVPCRR